MTAQNILNRKLLLINGANLHLLGKREPHIYGTTTLEDIVCRLSDTAHRHGVELVSVQSNHEGQIVDMIGELGVLSDDAQKFDLLSAMLFDEKMREKGRCFAEKAEVINLALEEDFQNRFIASIDFPH